jgi:hypothetical protein
MALKYISLTRTHFWLSLINVLLFYENQFLSHIRRNVKFFFKLNLTNARLQRDYFLLIFSLSADCMDTKSNNHAALDHLAPTVHICRISWRPDLIGQVVEVQWSLCLKEKFSVWVVNRSINQKSWELRFLMKTIESANIRNFLNYLLSSADT